MGPTVEFLTPEKSISGGSNKWTPEFKARLVSETLRHGARVVDVAQRYGVRANRLSMWRRLAKRGQLVLPAPDDGIEFEAGLVISEPLAEQSDPDTSCVEICIGPVTDVLNRVRRFRVLLQCARTGGLILIFPSNRVRVMVATKPVDFRKCNDGLAGLAKDELRKDPFTGTVFVFRSRKADRLKLIYWDGTGMLLAYKRLEAHAFSWPGIRNGLMSLNHAQFEALFAGLDWRRVRAVEARAPITVE